MREHAQAQAALFSIGSEDEPGSGEAFSPDSGKTSR
jgi:hypothetical protein